MSGVWVIRCSSAVDVIKCSVCSTVFCLNTDITLDDSVFVSIDAIQVANVTLGLNGLLNCRCNAVAGHLIGDHVFLYSFVRSVVAATEDYIGPIEWRYRSAVATELVWGCTGCLRPIGVGIDFAHHIAVQLRIMNAFVGLADPNEVRCVCGRYLGYKYLDRILLGELIALRMAQD